MKKLVNYFTKAELALWGTSTALILASFLAFDRANYMTLAALEDVTYVSVLICFLMFLVNDLYGFISWKRMEKRQMA